MQKYIRNILQDLNDPDLQKAKTLLREAKALRVSGKNSIDSFSEVINKIVRSVILIYFSNFYLL